MSLLPQRKKSPEEIAKLRENLGIPGPSPVAEMLPAVEIQKAEPAAKLPAPTPRPPLPDAPKPEPDSPTLPPTTSLELPPILTTSGVRAVRSLKRSERVPVLAVDEPVKITPADLTPESNTGKVVHSLRKSELIPITPADVHTPPSDSKLPVHRHSDQELNELRRKAAIAQHGAVIPFAGMIAHRALLIPGYLSAIAAAACFYYYDLSISITAGCTAVALLIAAFIFVKKPLSRHHAAFISVISLFVMVFGALRYFPQLSYGTFPLPTEEKSVIHKDL